MNALELSGLILAVEFALVAWAVLFFSLRSRNKATQQDHVEAGAVIKAVELGEGQRREALATVFKTSYGMDGEELEQKVDEYLDREKAFYNAMLNVYVERNGKKLSELPGELTKVLSPLVEMTPQGMVQASEIGDLTNANAELASELKDTKRTLSQLMEEYNAAFARVAPQPEAPQSEARQPAAPSEEGPFDELDGTAEAVPADLPLPESDPKQSSGPSFELAEEFDLAAGGPGALRDRAEEAAEDDLEELSDLFDLPPEARKPPS